MCEQVESKRLTQPPVDEPGAHKLPLATKIAYGFGTVAYGAKDSGLKYFLLLFF